MNVLVMGGTRLFGRALVWQLLQAGHKVTLATRGRTQDDFGDRVQRIVVDRCDESGMHAAFGHGADFDVIYDQLCYSPLDAAIAAEVFAGRTGRYVMTSTIEVYRPLLGRMRQPFAEADAVLTKEPVEWDYPWRQPENAEARYSAGKRQAEAVLLQDERLPVVMARMGHVIAGVDDFTLRTWQYVRQVMSGGTPWREACQMPSSFIMSEVAASTLYWLGMHSTHLGALNVAQFQSTSARLLYEAAQVAGMAGDTGVATRCAMPFDYDAPYCMDLSLLVSLGWKIPSHQAGLLLALREHMSAYRQREDFFHA